MRTLLKTPGIWIGYALATIAMFPLHVWRSDTSWTAELVYRLLTLPIDLAIFIVILWISYRCWGFFPNREE